MGKRKKQVDEKRLAEILDRKHDETAARLTEMFIADAQRWEADLFTEEDVNTAAMYWLSYPMFVAQIGIGWRNDVRQEAYERLQVVHNNATFALMEMAERLGIDSAPLWESAQECQQLFKSKTRLPIVYGEWPWCARPMIDQLPERVQSAMTAGSSAFAVLSVKLEIDTKEQSRLATRNGQTSESTLPKHLLIKLTSKQNQLIEHLWNSEGMTASFHDLIDASVSTSAEGLEKLIERTGARLLELRASIVFETGNEHVALVLGPRTN